MVYMGDDFSRNDKLCFSIPKDHIEVLDKLSDELFNEMSKETNMSLYENNMIQPEDL